ncbi:MAG: glycosyl hydrolase family 88 [Clostridiales bacterium]|jgi:unsaturated rhamnogalacturonyl hydrolase|nr:glycosyl hydrolase family 88 [Clostridiales bacterium]
MNKDKIEQLIHEYYSTFDHVRFHKWNYEDGCILLAAIELYRATGNDLFRNFVIEYLSKHVEEDGTITHYSKEEYNLDHIAPGRALIFAYEESGDERYRKAAETLMGQLSNHPRIEAGNYWHKKIYPNQVWLDGLFMAQPFYMAWETKYAKKEGYPDIASQFRNVRRFMFDEEKKLYYHGYDESRSIFWADKDTGLSANFWLRAIGWFLMSIIETMGEMSNQIYEYYDELQQIYKEAIKGVLMYQNPEEKLFYQVVDRPDVEGNYLESSGSAMIAASILKACRMKVLLDEKYWNIGEEILNSVIERKLVMKDGKVVLKDCCEVAGLGPYDNLRRDGSISYYLSEPVIENDNKALAALFMAYAQYLMGSK